MTCPRCYAEFTSGAGVCPECGIHLLRSVSGVVKTSAVMITSGGKHGFYRSVQDVPEPLRARLIEVTNGVNSGTIVIADKAGKEQITQVMTQRGNSCEAPPQMPGRALTLFGFSWILWIAAFLVLLAGAVIAAAFLAR